jgi:hypothetical protein
MAKVRITWSGQGGELDYAMVETKDDDGAITAAFIDLIAGQIITPGDSFTVEEVQP